MKKFIVTAALTFALAPASAFAGHQAGHPPNPAQTCRALQATNLAAFQQMFGTGSNAFGKCV